MASTAASFAGGGGKAQQYQLIPGLVGIHGSIVGQGARAVRHRGNWFSESALVARSHADLSLYTSGSERNYAVITSISAIRRASQNSAGALVSVINRCTPERGPMRETLLRLNLLKSATTLTSLEIPIIRLFSGASSTSGVDGPISRSKPSTARKKRSARNSLSIASACGPPKEKDTGRSSPP